MTKKLIIYAHWVIGFACASLFVEGVVEVKSPTSISNTEGNINDDDYDAANKHTIPNVGLTSGEKLIVAFAFETHDDGWKNVSVDLDVGNQQHSFNEVVTSGNGRFAGLYYLDVSSSISDSGALGTVTIDLGVYSGSGTGYSSGDIVVDNLGATVMSVSGLEVGDADYTDYGMPMSANETVTLALNTSKIDDGMFVASAFTTNGRMDQGNPGEGNGGNTSYTSTYHTSVGSAGGSFGYIKSFTSISSDTTELTYNTTNDTVSKGYAYAAWNVAIPESNIAVVVVAFASLFVCLLRRRSLRGDTNWST